MNKLTKWLLYGITGILFLTSVLSGGKTLYHYFILFLMIIIAMKLMLKHNERNLFILYYTSENTVSAGESINIDYKITNTSFIPIFHTVIDFKLDKKMNTDSALKEIAYFRNFDKINFSKDVICKHRGYYKIGQVTVDIFDPLMLDKRTVNFNKEIAITVYPKIIPVKELLQQSQDLFGTLKSNIRTLEDRTNLINIRPYAPGDQIKNIHWKLSAKTDKLHTKEFEQTVNTKSVVIMDGFKVENLDLDKEEAMVSFGVSLVKEFLDHDIKTKIIFNDGGFTELEAESSKDFQMALEAFTSFESLSDTEFAGFLNGQLEAYKTENSNGDESLVVIAQKLTDEFFEVAGRHNQHLNVYTFDPKSLEIREKHDKLQSSKLKITYMDQIMDVAYENTK